MKFAAMALPGAIAIEIEPAEDARGLFARVFCAEEFAAQRLPSAFAQHSISYNRKRGTVRGLHYQVDPPEGKLVRCLVGAAWDVLVDLRPESPCYRRWCTIELDARRRNAVFVPKGCAHGFQTLTDDAELLYLIDTPYRAEAASGIRWNDPTLAIPWPIADPILSERDQGLPWLA
jgi:dTDP-4-dehydrorhamnose 3,5-epimerase